MRHPTLRGTLSRDALLSSSAAEIHGSGRRTGSRACAALAIAALALGACQDDKSREAQKPAEGPAVQAPTTKVDTIKEEPARFYGKTVRVSGKVDKIYSDRAFQLEGSGWAFNDDITVLTSSAITMNGALLDPNDDVIVSGTVRPFVAADIKREVGWDMTPEIEVKLKQRPVLIATSISKIREYARWPSTADTGAVTSALTILISDPAAISGRKVDLARERVQSVQGKGLWIGFSPMSKVFVLPKDHPKDVAAGDAVHVVGTVQKATDDAAKTWDLPAGSIGKDTLYITDATVTSVGKPDTRTGQR